MKQITNKEFEKFQKYQTDELNGRILSADGLLMICQMCKFDPEKIGNHILYCLDHIFHGEEKRIEEQKQRILQIIHSDKVDN